MNTIDTYNGLGLSTSNTTMAKKAGLDQEQFLKLMTTQMTHQDPTKPMQNGEFLSQMAQFGTVSGIQDLQQSFKDFAASISSDQALQAASLVGRTVSASADEALLSAGGEVKGTVVLPDGSSHVSLKILDPLTGNVISSKILDGSSAGSSLPFVWDGMNDNGNLAYPGVYKVQVEASVDGVNTVLQPELQARVESVSMDNAKNGLQVNLAGLGAVGFNQIKQIL